MSNSVPAAQQNDALRQAAVVIRRLKERLAPLEQAEHERTEPIAIVGIGCRFPGGAANPEAFWELLDAGRDAVQPLEQRWALVGARPHQEAPRWAGLLTEHVDCFDPAFFGISPREARSLDPQQRLLLEVAWEGLENAGIPPGSLDGSRTGVFVGAIATDYLRTVERLPYDEQDVYCMIGNMLSVAAGRLSFTLGLAGPCITVDTACSSSLVAVHLACHSLRSRESDLTLAGGVNVLLSPMLMEGAARLQALSPEGRCRTFDAAANGFVRGEGCGLVVLKRFADAKRDGDRIWALIRGSAVNQDGKSTGLTAPNVLAQEAVLRDALQSARVDAEAIGYVETHGAATSLGDPIEVEALRSVVGRARADGTCCVLGAVKTNLGHLEGAAGVAGLIKAALALYHQRIPRNLNFRTQNPRIRLEGTALSLATEPTPWPRTERPRFAGVSSFGLSGTNAHAVLQEAPEVQVAAAAAARSAELFLLSAKSAAALDAQAARLRVHLQTHQDLALGDVAFSLVTSRSPMEHRLAVAATSREGLCAALEAAAGGQTPPGVARGRTLIGGAQRVVFMFPGQGSQWLGMGRQLLVEEPAFRDAVHSCDRAMQPELGWSVLAELAAEPSCSRLGHIDVVQPVLFALQVSLAALWRSWGVKPDAVVGHSMGEVAAAHVAGILNLDDAIRVICRRSRLLRSISGQGEMASVALSLAEAEAALSGYEGRLSVAVSNSPRATVIAGEPKALAELLPVLEQKGVFCRRVRVDVASHSPQVEPLTEKLLAALAGLRPGDGAVPMYSTVTGELVVGRELGASYWVDNLRKPVRFCQAMQALKQGCHGFFVEISPHPLLVPAVEELNELEAGPSGTVGSLRRGQPERAAMLEAVGTLWTQGMEVQRDRMFPKGGQRVWLPTYPWQRERHWVEPPSPPSVVARAPVDGHPLLGRRVRSCLAPIQFESTLDRTHPAYLAEHRVHGQVVVPATAYLEIALAAGAAALGSPELMLKDVSFQKALILAPDTPCTVQTIVTTEPDGSSTFAIHSAAATPGDGEAAPWTLHVTGVLVPALGEPLPPRELASEIPMSHEVTVDDFYRCMEQHGLTYGPSFRAVEQVRAGAGEAAGVIRLRTPGSYRFHPALLDACLQVISAVAPEGTYMPVGLARLAMYSEPGSELRSHAWVRTEGKAGAATYTADVHLSAPDGRPIATFQGLLFKQATREALLAGAPASWPRWLYTVEWRQKSAPGHGVEPLRGPESRSSLGGQCATAEERLTPSHDVSRWLLVGDTAGTAEQLARQLEALGDTCICVPAEDLDSVRAACAVTPPLRGIIYLAGLTASPGTGDVVAEAERATAGALHVIQEVLGATPERRPRVWLVTRGAVAIGPEDALPSVTQAPLWGLGKVVALEHPELWGGLVDLDPALDGDDAAALAMTLRAPASEDEMALRAGQRYAARLVRHRPMDVRATRLRAEGTYLITGGLGYLGLRMARWMIERGARHLVLVGRSTPSPEKTAACAALERLGAEVIVAAADVADKVALGRIIAEHRPGLRGIIHAAGIAECPPIAAMTDATLHEVFHAKVGGAWLLHELTQDLALDFFVCFSSASAVWGARGHAAYAAANHFLDGLVHHRRAAGLPGLSVNWALLGEGGMVPDRYGEWLREIGVDPMEIDAGLAALGYLLESGRTQAVVAKVDWTRFKELHQARRRRPLLNEIAAAAGEQLVPPGRIAEAGTVPAAGLSAYVREQIAWALGIPPAELDPGLPVNGFGIDSLMSFQLRKRFRTDLKLDIPLVKFLDGSSVAELTAYLEQSVESNTVEGEL